MFTKRKRFKFNAYLSDALYSEKCKIRAINEDMDVALQGIGDL